MEIKIKNEGDVTTLLPIGNIDYSNSAELDQKIEECSENANQIILDMQDVTYISSAGLRILLNADELMADKGGFIITHVSPSVMEVLVMTGFAEALTIES